MANAPAAEPTSLLKLYLAKRVDLVRFFTARSGSAAEAEDIVQELYFRIAQVEPGVVVNESAYLYRLGLNVMLDRFRSSKRRQNRDAAFHQASEAAPGTIDTADAPSPEEIADSRKRLSRLLKAASELPPQTRRVFHMHKIEGMPHSEVAAALGISKSAVEKHMITALKRLVDVR